MTPTTSRALRRLALAGLIALAPAATARAQFGPAGGRIATGIPAGPGFAGPVGPAFAGGGFFSPFGGYGANFDPYGGYLRGGADVVNAQGRFMVQRQQSRILQAEAERRRIENRRLAFDERQYELRNTPTAEELREKARVEALRRARNDPPPTEIWSAQALNDLLKGLQSEQARGVRGPSVPVSPELARLINVSGSSGGANVGVLRADGKLEWPGLLTGDDFTALRNRAESTLAEATRQAAGGGRVDPGLIRAANGAVADMTTLVTRKVNDVSFSDYVDAKRYLKSLDSGVQALASPNAGNYFSRKWSAQGETVADLVEYMGRNGLTFAPAAPGAESAYTALHRAMVSYDSMLAGRTMPQP